MTQAKILVIDDEPSILNLVTSYLRAEGFDYRTAVDGPAGLLAAQTYQPDLIVLDIMLPGMDGIELLSHIRRESDVYVIMLTAKAEETDKIVGLSVGADDYLTKPFSPRELVARIKAALRRIQRGSLQTRNHVIVFDDLRINTDSRQVWVKDELIELTATEYELFEILVAHQGLVLSREQLLEKVWGHEYFGEIRVVDVHLGHVRQKLGLKNWITTVRGVGYRFSPETSQS